MPAPNFQATLAASNASKAERKRRDELNRTEGQRLLARAGMDAQRLYSEKFQEDAQQLRRTALGLDAGSAVGRVRANIGLAGRDVDIASGAGERERRAVGVTANAADTRRVGLARVLAQVDAGNRTSEANVRRQEAAQQWGAQQWGNNATDAFQTLAGIARSENDRENQYRQARAQYRSNVVGTLTGIGGMALGAVI